MVTESPVAVTVLSSDARTDGQNVHLIFVLVTDIILIVKE